MERLKLTERRLDIEKARYWSSWFSGTIELGCCIGFDRNRPLISLTDDEITIKTIFEKFGGQLVRTQSGGSQWLVEREDAVQLGTFMESSAPSAKQTIEKFKRWEQNPNETFEKIVPFSTRFNSVTWHSYSKLVRDGKFLAGIISKAQIRPYKRSNIKMVISSQNTALLEALNRRAQGTLTLGQYQKLELFEGMGEIIIPALPFIFTKREELSQLGFRV